MAVPISGTLPTQKEPEYFAVSRDGIKQEKNDAGGYSYVVNDLMLLQRYIIIGSETGTYYVTREMLGRDCVKSLERLIANGLGVKAVELIKSISVDQRNVKQNCLLYALAICARSKDAETKAAAYGCLPDVCRIPTHLFLFIKFCEQESGGGTGWGRAHRRAVSNWYQAFRDKPEDLARLVVKYKNREGWTHRDVIRLAHVRCAHPPLAFIIRYVVKSYQHAYNMYLAQESGESGGRAEVEKIATLLKGYDDAVHCQNVEQLCDTIRGLNLTWEMVATNMLKKREVWLALLPGMPLEALLRNLGRMTSLELLTENSEDEETVLTKLRSINRDDSTLEGEGEGQESNPETESNPTEEQRRNFVHPFKLLQAWATYKTGTGEKGKLQWDPNTRIVDALMTAFYQAFKQVEPTHKKLFLAVDVSGSMSQHVLGSRSITCAQAAASIVMQTVRTERNYVVKGFSDGLLDLPVTPSHKLEVVLQMISDMTYRGTDCAQPMMHAQEQRMKDIDAFIVFTDSDTCSGKVHPTEALRQYRQYAGNGSVKLIVCAMTASKFTVVDPGDPYRLDIVGFDSAAPKLISDFIMERI